MRVPLLVLLCCCVPASLAAQLPSDDCVDRSGRQVRGLIRNDLPWAGAATEVNGEAVIYWNQSRNSRASLVARLFIYMHECAHHTLGHVWKMQGPQWEAEADCWAVQRLWERGLLRGRGLRQLESDLRLNRSGRRRLASSFSRNLNDCITVKTDRGAWGRSLDALAAASADSFGSISGQAVPRPSARTGIHESVLDLPGTYDCEVASGRDLHCDVFEGTSDRATVKRYRALAGIIRGWMPDGWRAEEPPAGPGVLRRLVVSDTVGSRLTLSATADRRVVFVMHPMPRSRDALLPPERIAFRLTYPESPCAKHPDQGEQMRFIPHLMLFAAGSLATGCSDAPPAGGVGGNAGSAPAAAGPAEAPAAATATTALRDPVQLSIEAAIGGRRYRAEGLGECQHTPEASIYAVPASMWRASYDGQAAGDPRNVGMTLWQPNAGGAMQANLSVTVGDRTHRIATVTGGTLVGSGTASVRMDGAAATLAVSGRDEEGTAVEVSVRCERLTVPVAEGG